MARKCRIISDHYLGKRMVYLVNGSPRPPMIMAPDLCLRKRVDLLVKGIASLNKAGPPMTSMLPMTSMPRLRGMIYDRCSGERVKYWVKGVGHWIESSSLPSIMSMSRQ